MRNLKLVRTLSIFLGLCASLMSAGAQSLLPSSSVRDLVPVVSVSVSPGSTYAAADNPVAWLEASFVLPRGMHQTLQEQYFGFRLNAQSLPAGWSAGKIVYPPTLKKILNIPSYDGAVAIRMPLYHAEPDAVLSGSKEQDDSPANQSFTVRADVLWQLCYDDGVCLLPAAQKFEISAGFRQGRGYAASARNVGLTRHLSSMPPAVPVESGDAASLPLMLLFAFLGGLILNLMPCVLPVLSLKALSLVKQGTLDLRSRWTHAAAMGGGVILSLLTLAVVIIAFQAGGAWVGWGFQFQNPWYVVGILTVVLLFALSLFEVFVLRSPTIRRPRPIGNANPGIARSFFSGFMTVVLATPCSAPLLGTALGFAFVSTWWTTLLVFFCVGLGLSLPFILVAIIPGVLERLPKPGRWMEIFQQGMGFALLATAIWLLTVLRNQVDEGSFARVLWFLGLVSAMAWLYGRLQKTSTKGVLRAGLKIGTIAVALSGVIFLLAAPPLSATGGHPASTNTPDTRSSGLPPGWTAFSDEEVSGLLQTGTPVFVDFTADWCLTCKVNEAGVLADREVLREFSAKGVTLVRGDYTNADPEISNWLRKYGRAGIPFYALLQKDHEAVLFSELPSKQEILNGLQNVAAPVDQIE